jgi:hypothetical protein
MPVSKDFLGRSGTPYPGCNLLLRPISEVYASLRRSGYHLATLPGCGEKPWAKKLNRDTRDRYMGRERRPLRAAAGRGLPALPRAWPCANVSGFDLAEARHSKQ